MRRFTQGFILGFIVGPALFLVPALFGYLPVDAKASPPALEARLANQALTASLDRHAANLANPVAPTEANLMEGMKMYKNMCAGCHGSPNGESTFGASFYPRAPQFAEHAPRRPDWQLFWIIKNGVRYTSMPAWDVVFGKNADEQTWKAVTFLSHLDSLPPAVYAEWHRKPDEK